MSGDKGAVKVLNGYIAMFALSGLLLPAAIYLLLLGAGLLPGDAREFPSLRWFPLALGMLAGGFGVCTAPLGFPVILRLLRVPAGAARPFARVLTDAWLLAAVTLGLAGHALWQLLPLAGELSSEYSFNIFLSALALLAGNAVRIGLEIRVLRKRREFGKVVLEPDGIKCAPGGRASAYLTLQKKPQDIEAGLELCRDSGDEEPVTAPVEVSGPEPRGEGWVYTLSFKVPDSVKLSGEDSWLLTVKVRGRGGVRHFLTADIEP